MKLNGPDYELSLFPEFSKYLLTEYIGRRKLPNLSHLAFADEPRYVKIAHRLAMVASTDKEEECLALATWNKEDYEE